MTKDKKLSLKEWSDKYFPKHKYLFQQDEDNRIVIKKPMNEEESNEV